MNDLIHKQRILVVEDEDALRDLYVEIFTEAGFVVDSARDGEAGLDLIIKDGYDLVLLDIMLPKFDGLQVLEKIKTTSGKQLLEKVVLLTNLGQDLIIAKALEYGVRGYLLKSEFNPAQLIAEVKNYLKTP